MKRRNRFHWLIVAAGAMPIAAAAIGGCLQSYDPESASGGAVTAGSGADAGGAVTCPPGEVCTDPGVALSAQCTLDSPQCFYLCGSPLCSLGTDPDEEDAGAALPQTMEVDPPIYLGSTDDYENADGSATADPCVQVEAHSLAIRQRSCTPCHTGQPPAQPQGAGNLNFILNDSMLVSSTSAEGLMNSSGTLASYVVPGDPADSLIYERVVAGPSNGGMPPDQSIAQSYLGPEAGEAIVYPGASDLSVLYAWILNCVTGADGGEYGAYSQTYYGGGVNGTTCFGPCDAGAEGGTN